MATQSTQDAAPPSIPDMKSALEHHFASMALVYDELGPQWSIVAQQMLDLNTVPIDAKSIVHDNGCGTGQVSIEVLRRSKSASDNPQIYATDFSGPMIQQLEKRNPPLPVVSSVLNSEDLSSKFGDEFFTHSIASLVLMTSPNPGQIVKETFRTLKDGGIALASTWATFGFAPIADKALHRVRLEAPTFSRPPIPAEFASAEWLKALFVDAGFHKENVNVHKTRVDIAMADMSDAARNVFCEGILMLLTPGWDESEKTKLLGELVKSFSPTIGDADGFDHEVWICVARK